MKNPPRTTDEENMTEAVSSAFEGIPPKAAADEAADKVGSLAGQALPEVRALSPEEIRQALSDMGEKAFRGSQVFRWLQKRAAESYEEMTDLPEPLRRKLAEKLPIERPALLRLQKSSDGTRKFLFGLAGGANVETVLMNHRESSGHIRHTLCISSQAGCAMGCVFCATGLGGFCRNLTCGEIVGQVLEVAGLLCREDPEFTVDNLVYMGMGEPMLNLDNVLKSIRLLNHPDGQKIGIRRITLSTCGLPQGIRRLAAENPDVTLAVSLHSPTDRLRDRLMPINKKYPIREVLSACRDYCRSGGGRITFEYIMIQGINIGSAEAEALCVLLRGLPCHVNLIPVNDGPHGFGKPGRQAQEEFRRRLSAGGLEASIREEKGADISGACGQLAGQAKNQGV